MSTKKLSTVERTPGSRPPARVSTSDLHRDTRAALNVVKDTGELFVTHYNQVEGVLLSADRYQELVVAASDAHQARSALPMLLAAAAAGVSVPSDTLDLLMPDRYASENWRSIAVFASRFPVEIAAGEHGEPIANVRIMAAETNLPESGTDDELLLD
jgi:hypothetical protein